MITSAPTIRPRVIDGLKEIYSPDIKTPTQPDNCCQHCAGADENDSGTK